ncbi:hypothetical protein Ancab_022750 [Ancistrocladus abbreviatus]
MWNSPENPFANTSSDGRNTARDEEEALKWAAIQRLTTLERARKSLFRNIVGDVTEVDICKLGSEERNVVLDRLVNAVHEDPENFFFRLRNRFKAVGLEFPRIEVRFEHLKVDAFVHVGSRALPTIPNFILNMSEAFLRQFGIFRGKRMKLSILNDISGIVRPSRLTLLLGPPSSGKTTFLLALAGRLGNGVQMSGKISYNGHELKEFAPQRTSAYVSQKDQHMGEMTVREVLEFSGCCQGVGFKYGTCPGRAKNKSVCRIHYEGEFSVND